MKRIYVVSYLLVAAFALSCKAVDYSEAPPAPVSQFTTDEDQLLIDRGLKVLQLSDAERVAQRFMFKDTKKLLAVSAATRADHLTAVRDSAGNAVMYVVNFDQGGFCIVSATKKAYPILAHGDDGFFDLEKVDESGVCIWLDDMVYGITHRDTLSEEERIFVNSAWAEYEKRDDLAQTRAYGDMSDPRYAAFSNKMSSIMGGNGNAIPLNNASASGQVPQYVIDGFRNLASNQGCPIEYAIIASISNNRTETIGPLVKTNWHQDLPFNNNCYTKLGQKAVAGCPAIAIGQIMNYYQHPYSFYDWKGIAAKDETHLANYIGDVGKSLGTTYGVTGSFATDDQVFGALVSKYKYKAKLIFTNPISEIQFKRPYYAAGTTAAGEGHSWIVDGTKKYYTSTIFRLYYQVYRNGQYVYETSSGYDYDYASRDPMHQMTHVNWGADNNGSLMWCTEVDPTYTYPYDFKYYRAYITMDPIDREFPPIDGGGPIILPPPGGGGGGIILPPGGGGGGIGIVKPRD